MPLNTKIPQQIVSSTTQALSVKRGEPAMLVADMNRGTIVLMDGKTYGGIPAAREDTQIRAGSSAITVNDGEWSALTGIINIGINPEGFIENAVSPTDKVLAIGDDGKIAAQLSVSYDETSGLFSLKGKDGETISSFTLVIPTGITPKSVALVENPEGQEPGLYLEFVFIDDDDVEIKLYANMDVLKDVYTAGRGITISEDRVISVDEGAISGVIADDLIEENSGLKVVNDKLHLDDHASETPEYGLGDEDNYGHVRLADAGDSRATVQAGIAATPAAVKDVDDRAVHKEGDETISGVKTFVDTPKVTLSDGSVTEVATVDGTVWNKRVDELPEDTAPLTENMPVGALLVMPSEGHADIFQVVDQDGQKALVDVPVGSDSIATADAPGVVRPDSETVRVDNTGVLSAIGGNLQFNDEIWITESGDWEVPYDGVYEVFVIDGGNSASVASPTATATVWANAGAGGAFDTIFLYLTAGTVIPVTIGAGGVPISTADGGWNTAQGGVTSFGTFTSTPYIKCFFPSPSPVFYPSMKNSISSLLAVGGGIGAHASGQSLEDNNGKYYGAGGSSMWAPTITYVGTGYQGVVRLRFWNPDKAASSVE